MQRLMRFHRHTHMEKKREEREGRRGGNIPFILRLKTTKLTYPDPDLY